MTFELKDITQFLKDEDGAQMVEYALLIALIGILLIVAMTFLKDSISAAFNTAGDAVNPGS